MKHFYTILKRNPDYLAECKYFGLFFFFFFFLLKGKYVRIKVPPERLGLLY